MRRSLRSFIAALGVSLLAITAAAPSSPAQSGSDPQTTEAQFLQLLNNERASAELDTLSVDASLVDLARSWSAEMASSSSLGHNPDLGAEIDTRLGSGVTHYGENVGQGATAESIDAALMASEGHRKNILGDYSRVGVGVEVSGTTLWVTFDFAKLAGDGTSSPPAPPATEQPPAEEPAPARPPLTEPAPDPSSSSGQSPDPSPDPPPSIPNAVTDPAAPPPPPPPAAEPGSEGGGDRLLAGAGDAGGDSTELPRAGSGGFPADLQALKDSVVRSGPSSTVALMAALAPLVDAGMDPTEAAVVGFGSFPVAGKASYIHDWWFPRFGPGWRLHQGTDIFAAMGTPVRAPVAGVVRIARGGLGGLAVSVVQPDGTYWYLAHLANLAPGLAEGAQVTLGQVVAYVGNSGNAAGGPAHVHAELHPQGGPAVDPKATLDRFLADALAAAPALVATRAQNPEVLSATVASTPLVSNPPVLPSLPWASKRILETDTSSGSGPLQPGAGGLDVLALTGLVAVLIPTGKARRRTTVGGRRRTDRSSLDLDAGPVQKRADN